MTLDDALIKIKDNLEKSFENFRNVVERNKKTEHGKVINKLLTCEQEVLYLFEGLYVQSSLSSMSVLFCSLNHAFEDDGEVYIKKIKSPLSGEQLGDLYHYKIAIGENPEGRGLSHKDFYKIINMRIELSVFERANKESIDKAFSDSGSEEDNAIYNECASGRIKIEEFMKAIYKRNQHRR